MNNDGLTKIVEHYHLHFRQALDDELAYFAQLPLSEAVSQAALGCDPTGQRHTHQRRIPNSSLQESARRLADRVNVIRSSGSFASLLDEQVGPVIRPIWRIGPLTVYDTALRIGARLGLEPTNVYLHSGTRKGAEALGISVSGESLALADLPAEFQGLAPKHLENMLCIYKDALGEGRKGNISSIDDSSACAPVHLSRAHCALV